jgi:virginiamycin B lyase
MSRRKLPLLALLTIVTVGTTMAQVPSLSFDKYTVPFFAWSITAGPDGALGFTEPNVNKIGRITTDGAITEYHDGEGR